MTVVVQLSDPHIGADWGVRDPAEALARAVAEARALEPDATIVTGDVAEHAADAEYELAREILAGAGAPVHVLPGNHDDRAALRRHFGLPGAGAERVTYAAESGGLRMLILDSTIPGEDAGELGAEQLAWLDGELSASAAPALVALHHPPIATGIPAADALALDAEDGAALRALAARHAHVLRIAAGHVHRTIAGEQSVFVAPSAYVQLRLELRAEETDVTAEPAGFAVHVLTGGGLASHVVPVTADRTR